MTTQIIPVPSSDRKALPHSVTVENGAAVHCTCEGFRYRRGCRHLAEALAIVARGEGPTVRKVSEPCVDASELDVLQYANTLPADACEWPRPEELVAGVKRARAPRRGSERKQYTASELQRALWTIHEQSGGEHARSVARAREAWRVAHAVFGQKAEVAA